jgi:hypothetical protein
MEALQKVLESEAEPRVREWLYKEVEYLKRSASKARSAEERET